MSSKRPIVLNADGTKELLQSGDTLDVGGYDVPNVAGTVNQVLKMGATDPSWDTILEVSSGGTVNQVLTNNGGGYTWADLPAYPPFTDTLDSVCDRGAVTDQTITAGALKVDATIDHDIYDDSDELRFKNSNESEDIVMSVNAPQRGGQCDVMSIKGAYGRVEIMAGSRYFGTGYGCMRVTGEATSIGIVADVMSMEMTHSSPLGSAIVFNNKVTKSGSFTGSGGLLGVQNNIGGCLVVGASITNTGISNSFGSVGAATGTVTTLGESVIMAMCVHPDAGTSTYTNIAFNAAMPAAFAGAGTVDYRCYGVKLTGFGAPMSTWGSAIITNTLYSFYSDGGDIALVSDSAKFKSGGGEDHDIGYDGTDAIYNISTSGSHKFTGGPLLLPPFTTTARDALTPLEGMVIYNTTTTTIQGYQGGSWTNL